MTDKQREYIVAIASEKNVTRAAEKLFVTQSSLSQTLAHVEKELGIKIFNRTGSELIPTYEGNLFLRSCRQILEIQDNLRVQYKDLEENHSGLLKIGIAPQRSWLFIPHIIPDYTRLYPAVQIELTDGYEKELVELLLDGKVDLIITITSRLHPELSYIPLFTEDFLVFLAKDNPVCEKAVDHRLDLQLLKDTPFILTKSGYNLRNNVDRILTDAGVCPHILMESGSMDVCMQMAAFGLGVAILPDSLYYFHEFKNRVQVFPTGRQYQRQISFVYRKNTYLPYIMREFIRIASVNLNAMHAE
ncbi:MAG: LysR family transcriptional regulator [Clostridium sp.]|nr:LysR family transcriptional regulator [Clostridium sp.]